MSKPDLGATHAVPFAVTQPDRIPKQRYYDKEFYELEREKLWTRVWQMACRLEEIPKRGDYVVYNNLDQSIIVTRVDDSTVKAYHNACRHRGAQLCKDRGRKPAGFICPYHGWSWDLKGENTFVHAPELFDSGCLDPQDLKLRECRLETWGGCAFINLDDNAPALRESIEPFASMHDAWHVDTLRTEWWLSTRLSCNWKLAMEAFQEAYHVMQSHPQLMPPGVPRQDMGYLRVGREFPMARYWTLMKQPPPFDPKMYVEGSLVGMKLLSEGMAGMTHAKDVQIAEGLRHVVDLPADDPLKAGETWFRTLHQAVVDANQKKAIDIPDLNQVMDQDLLNAVNFCFPHFFLLPTLSSAASYRIRPLGPEECLFEMWSLTRYAEGEEPPPAKTPTPMEPDDPALPLINRQDFANLRGQQASLHGRGIDQLRLSREVEGVISNNHRLIDGYLAGLGYDKLLPAAHNVSGPIDVPIADLGF